MDVGISIPLWSDLIMMSCGGGVGGSKISIPLWSDLINYLRKKLICYVISIPLWSDLINHIWLFQDYPHSHFNPIMV